MVTRLLVQGHRLRAVGRNGFVLGLEGCTEIRLYTYFMHVQCGSYRRRTKVSRVPDDLIRPRGNSVNKPWRLRDCRGVLDI